MENIERINAINKRNLNEEFYLQSLIEEATRCNLLSDNDIEKIQFGCLELLAYKVKCYNGLDSDSIRVEFAENIMKSNLYTISLYLKSFLLPEYAVEALQNTTISDLYDLGKRHVQSKLNATKHLHLLVVKNKLNTENYTYNSTVIDGIKGFFKLYDPDYSAHDIHITADYPTCYPIKNLVGVEFIKKYLENIYYENQFCSYFSLDKIHNLLLGYHKEYCALVINIFEQVFTSAIGCILIGVSAKTLTVSSNQVDKLYIELSSKTDQQIIEIIHKANLLLQKELSIKSKTLQTYLDKCLPVISSNICNAIKINTLDKIFITRHNTEIDATFSFSFGVKMDNETYRNLIDNIMQCRFLSDKIDIIKNNIHSLSDFEDMLLDSELTKFEIMNILKLLNTVEIAALIKRHPYQPDTDALELKDNEIMLNSCLNNYVNLQTLFFQNQIAKILCCIDIE